MLFNPIEVGVNTLHDLVGFSFAKPLYKPFISLVVVLAVVASALAIFSIMAQGNYIFRDSPWARWIGQWYPVVSSKSVPQTSGTTANSAAVAEVLQGTFPISYGKGIRERTLAGITSLGINRRLSFVVLPPDAMTGSFLLGILFVPALIPKPLFGAMRAIVNSTSLPYLVAVRLTIAVCSAASLIGMLAIPLCRSILVTVFTRCVSTVSSLRMFIEGDQRFELLTNRTAFEREVHSASLSLDHMMASADGVISRLRRQVATPDQADFHIIPCREAVR